MPHLRIIPTDRLRIDPDVQLEFALEPRRVARYAKEWNPNLVGVLTIVPSEKEGFFNIIDGRHRFLAGRGEPNNVPEWRSDVHDECKTIQDKVALKLAIDRDRRRVSLLELFKVQVVGGDPTAVAINDIVENAGFRIGKTSKHQTTTISAVGTVEWLYRTLGANGLRRTFNLNTHWLGEPATNTGEWLRALGLMVRDDYDNALTPAAWKRLDAVVPAKAVRAAKGEVEVSGGSGSGTTWGAVPYAIARKLRKQARLRQRPAAGREGGHRSLPL